MVTDAVGRHLFDRLIRGEVLTPEERAQLTEWYAAHFRAEGAESDVIDKIESIVDNLMRANETMKQLAATATRTKGIASENEAPRNEYEMVISKIGRLPEQLLREVDDFIDFLQMKHGGAIAVAESQSTHPITLAYGLWKDEPDLDSLVDRIYTNRRRQVSRPQVSL